MYCNDCGTNVGWRYECASDLSQKYKEGKFILERVRFLPSAAFFSLSVIHMYRPGCLGFLIDDGRGAATPFLVTSFFASSFSPYRCSSCHSGGSGVVEHWSSPSRRSKFPSFHFPFFDALTQSSLGHFLHSLCLCVCVRMLNFLL